MEAFNYHQGELYCEECRVDDILKEVGSPVFIYSKKSYVERLAAIREAFDVVDPLICFSVKSCPNLHLLRVLHEQGAGMDVVSGGELYRALSAGSPASNIVFAGVGKSRLELEMAIEAKPFLINVESEQELERLYEICLAREESISVGIRVNLDVADPNTPEKTATGGRTSKFGVPLFGVVELFKKYRDRKFINLTALHVHLGSPITSALPYLQAIGKLDSLVGEIRSQGCSIQVLDIGGGFPTEPDSSANRKNLAVLAKEICSRIKPLTESGIRIVIEPGRSVSADSGILVSRVEYIKQGWDKKIIVLDAGMNVLIRPTLYGSKHFIWPSIFQDFSGPWTEVAKLNGDTNSEQPDPVDIVGPICESGDFLALNYRCELPPEGGYMAVFSSGAYGMSMASQYNSRPRPAEVLVDGGTFKVIRRREAYEDLVKHEIDDTDIP
ncbi:diaminopimelate decarboxylase [Gluconacetobacter sacchari DSM 12717]|uniref:Diaminopimelate decarboxylase n=2 Tax=Gluconacetobacter sacchari TaxID=92759 RepID=A0A7W4IGI2_9PROT|nr:diaminopimelate decarboxylase [Gluconacetobacter sacchari]MBB2162444.1 diaminopimelate decarboxylase [Gluconacetobacter sacchari]GBQ18774.1 diaminopimelate decarboxylase [Gluconacetobacter sacchari DSM 12717]